MWEAWAESDSHGLVHKGYARRPEWFGRNIDPDFFFDLASLASVTSVKQRNLAVGVIPISFIWKPE